MLWWKGFSEALNSQKTGEVSASALVGVLVLSGAVTIGTMLGRWLSAIK